MSDNTTSWLYGDYSHSSGMQCCKQFYYINHNCRMQRLNVTVMSDGGGGGGGGGSCGYAWLLR